MAAGSAVDYLLEKMMQLLINSDNELIPLKAYDDEEKVVVIEKEEMEWVYKEMQFLSVFLKDSEEKRDGDDEHEEELKRLVARIRDVSYRVEDIIDWFLLKAELQLRYGIGSKTAYDFDLFISSSKGIMDKALKISESFKFLIDDICSVIKCKAEVLEDLSSFRCRIGSLADQILDGFRDFKFEMEPIIKEAMRVLDKGSSRTWLGTNLSREKIREIDHLINTSSKEVHDGLAGIASVGRQIYSNKALFTLTWLLGSLQKIVSLCRLSLQKIGEIDHLLNCGKEIHFGPGRIIQKIRSILEDVILEINEKVSGIWYGDVYRLYTILLEFSHVTQIICEPTERRNHYGEKPSDWHPFWLAEQCCELFSRYEEMVDLAVKIRHSFGRIAEEIKPIKAEVATIYEEGYLSVPSTNAQTTNEFLDLPTWSTELDEKIFHSFGCVTEDINSIKTQVVKIYQKSLGFSRLQSVMGDEIHKWFAIVTEEIKSIKREANKMYAMGVLRVDKSSRGVSSVPTAFIVKEELIVGFDDETTLIMHLLTEEHGTQLKFIPIIGMPGLGKTTLAIKVYNNPFTVYYFHIRAWTHVSVLYRSSRNLLLTILSSAQIQLKGKIDKMSHEELGEGLYKSLKGKKYLIVMDDIWEINAWNDIKRYFPNDNNGSRIIFTSRNGDVALALRAEPHYLQFLNSDKSWNLLRQKVFQGGSCPQELIEIGKQIAIKCQGLPLTIVVIAGLLAKKDKTQDSWRKVAESVSSHIATELEQLMNILALSYNHLPYHLKPCFLYFEAFREYYEIPVEKLLWLWVAEGIIVQKQQKSLEEVAEDYMMDLIERSLVIVSKKRSNGRIKTCRVHDLLRDLCLRKAREENFLAHVSMNEPKFPSSPMAKKQRRICISRPPIDFVTFATFLNEFDHSKYGDPEVRSLSSTVGLNLDHLLLFCRAFRLLRVLNMSSFIISSFPEELQLLVHLRYLSIHIGKEYFEPSVSNLWKLETFIIEGEPTGSVSFSDDIWKMVKLRHLYGKQFIEIPNLPNDDYPFMLDGLQTMSKLDLRGVDEQFLRWIPNLKKLTCCFMESLGGNYIFPKLNFLVHLETLNITYGGSRGHHGRFPHLDEFPPNLKSLTLSNFRLSWEEMSTLGSLPNLEILKLSYKAFEGPRWDTSDGQFHKLKFLRFQRLDIKQWTTSSSHFPVLQTLVFDDCKQLEEIPSGLGDIFTLEMIRLWYCSSSAAHSVRQIQNWQRSMGNDGLEIHIYPWNDEDRDEDIEDEDDTR